MVVPHCEPYRIRVIRKITCRGCRGGGRVTTCGLGDGEIYSAEAAVVIVRSAAMVRPGLKLFWFEVGLFQVWYLGLEEEVGHNFEHPVRGAMKGCSRFTGRYLV